MGLLCPPLGERLIVLSLGDQTHLQATILIQRDVLKNIKQIIFFTDRQIENNHFAMISFFTMGVAQHHGVFE